MAQLRLKISRAAVSEMFQCSKMDAPQFLGIPRHLLRDVKRESCCCPFFTTSIKQNETLKEFTFHSAK